MNRLSGLRMCSVIFSFAISSLLLNGVFVTEAQSRDSGTLLEQQFAFDVEIPNPSNGAASIQLEWQIQLIPIEPNTTPIVGRSRTDDPTVYREVMEGSFEHSLHILVVLEGTVEIVSSQGKGIFSQGQGTMIDRDSSTSQTEDAQYSITNTGSQCAVVLRIAVFGNGGMAGPGSEGRPSREVPQLAPDCGERTTVASGASKGFEGETMKVGLAALWRTAPFYPSMPQTFQLNHKSILVVQKGSADISIDACPTCNSPSMRAYPPSAIDLAAGQTVDIEPSPTRDTRIVLVAFHSAADTPSLYNGN